MTEQPAFEPTPTSSAPIYRAEQASDGTWTIHDVPVFAAHSEELADGRTRDFSAGWLRRALERGLTRQAEGYLPPLHVGHHGSEPVEAAGKFRLVRVGPIRHGGQVVQALFADLVGVTPETFGQIRRGGLSYRSVEILDVNEPEIDSLALLDDEVPFFRFPLLRVADTGGAAAVYAAHAGPVLAYSATGHRAATLTRFQEQTMTTPTETATRAAEEPAAQPKKAAAAEDLLAQIFNLLKAYMDMAMAPEDSPAPVEQPAEPMQAAAAPVEQPVPDLAAEGKFSALAARLAKLERTLAERDLELRVDREASALVTAGYSAPQVEAFRGAARDHGLQAALAFASGLRLMGPSDPPTHWTGELRPEAVDAPEVSAFAARGAAALAQARDLHASWKRTKSPLPFATYHEVNTTDCTDYLANR